MRRPRSIGVTNLGTTPHCVEWASDRDWERGYDLAYFSSSEDARKFAEAKASANLCVSRCQIGAYEDENGQIIHTWIYHWWNPQAYDNPLPERGRGYLDEEKSVAYTPIEAKG